MKKKSIVALCLLVILSIGLPGAVFAKGGQGKQHETPISKQTDQSEEPGGAPEEPGRNQNQERKGQEQEWDEEQEDATVPETATHQFRERLTEQLRLHLGQDDGNWTDEMEDLASHAEQQRFTPEETAGLFMTMENMARSGISNRFGAAVAIEGMRAGESATRIENTLQLMERLHQQFHFRILRDEDQNDEDRVMELARNMSRLWRQERFEERLRKFLQDGCTLEDAVNQLLP